MQDLNQPSSSSPSPTQTAPSNQSPNQPSPSTPLSSQPTSPQQPMAPPTPPPQPITTTPSPQIQTIVGSTTTQAEYASFGRRAVANIIDVIILALAIYLPLFVIGFFIGISGSSNNINNSQGPTGFILSIIQQLITIGANILYPLYFIGSRGQTPGKMIVKIKVLRLDQKEPPGYTTAFLREIVGKILSSMVFALGYFWMLWDDKKQTWHDKIASTIAVKAE